jgi:hypothetical protein
MRARIAKLQEQVKELTIKNATLKRSLKRAKEAKEVDPVVPVQIVASNDGKRCICGLKLFNGRCLNCKNKQLGPLSTF